MLRPFAKPLIEVPLKVNLSLPSRASTPVVRRLDVDPVELTTVIVPVIWAWLLQW